MYDTEANACFCLLFSVSAWPPRTPLDCMILPAFLQFRAILKPMGAFAYFSWIQPGRPEPLPDCTILPASSNFERYWNQWILVLTFLGFSLTVQNMQNLSKIGPKTHPKHRRKKTTLSCRPVVLDVLLAVSAGNCWQVLLHCYFLLFPTISWYFLLFHGISCYFLLPAISCYFLVFQLIPAISNYLLLFPIISKNVMLSPTIPYYFLRFLLFPMISC